MNTRRRSRTRRRTPPAAAWSVALSGRSRTAHCISHYVHRACKCTLTHADGRGRGDARLLLLLGQRPYLAVEVLLGGSLILTRLTFIAPENVP